MTDSPRGNGQETGAETAPKKGRPTDTELAALLRQAARYGDVLSADNTRAFAREARAAADAIAASKTTAQAEAVASLCNCGAGFIKPMPHDATCPKARFPRLLLARVTEQGTAAAETALCTVCLADGLSLPHLTHGTEGAASPLDCTANEALQCTQCGWRAAR